MTMTRKTTVNPTLLIIIIEIMMTGDDAAETWMNPIILWAAIPGTMACHAMEDAMAIQETTGQMVGDSRAFSVPRRRHQPQRGTILSSTELQCRATGPTFLLLSIWGYIDIYTTRIFVL